MLGVGGAEDLGPLGSDEFGAAVVDVSGGEQRDPRVVVLVVVLMRVIVSSTWS